MPGRLACLRHAISGRLRLSTASPRRCEPRQKLDYIAADGRRAHGGCHRHAGAPRRHATPVRRHFAATPILQRNFKIKYYDGIIISRCFSDDAMPCFRWRRRRHAIAYGFSRHDMTAYSLCLAIAKCSPAARRSNVVPSASPPIHASHGGYASRATSAATTLLHARSRVG